MGEKRNNCENQKIVFMGTPQIAAYALNALLDKNYLVAAIVCQPDKPSGRKQQIVFSEVKKIAIKKGILFFQPLKIKDIKPQLDQIKPFAFVTCAFGQFIPDDVLAIPSFGCVNVHASLLPKYRGGAPIHWAIINGEKETGVCLMQTIKKMDAGDVYSCQKIAIDDNETTSSLFQKMNHLVYQIVFNDLEKVFSGQFLPKPQDENEVSFAYNITKENERINFLKPAHEIRNLIRGLSDFPGAYCLFNDKKIKLFNCYLTNKKSEVSAGSIVDVSKAGIEIATIDFNIIVKELQFEGKKRLAIEKLLNGNLELKKGGMLA